MDKEILYQMAFDYKRACIVYALHSKSNPEDEEENQELFEEMEDTKIILLNYIRYGDKSL